MDVAPQTRSGVVVDLVAVHHDTLLLRELGPAAGPHEVEPVRVVVVDVVALDRDLRDRVAEEPGLPAIRELIALDP